AGTLSWVKGSIHACQEGHQEPGRSVACLTDDDCDDGNPCTDDTCTDDAVCDHINNSAPCTDNLFCNGADACQDGTCSVHSGGPCVGSQCDEQLDRCVGCLDDIDCDDGNICTDNFCDDGICENVNNSDPCTDNLFCNGADTCGDGSCTQHAGTPCAAGELCHEGSQACAECFGDGDCNDDNPCTTDRCNAGICARDNNTVPCNDGLFCNGTDTCQGGSCSVHTGDPCAGAGALCDEPSRACLECVGNGDCDDGNPCTDNICTNNTCTYPNTDGLTCDLPRPARACTNGNCVSDGSTTTVTGITSGNSNSAARLFLLCEDTGASCRVEGNRGGAPDFERTQECSITCPVGSDLTVCCSNGSDPCGGTPAEPRDSRSVDSFNISGFFDQICTDDNGTTFTDEPSGTTEFAQCTMITSAQPGSIRCGFTD
ncbi:MAG: hypothetical protein AAFX99_27010, partial [Myxococcota bacterium]